MTTTAASESQSRSWRGRRMGELRRTKANLRGVNDEL